MKTIRISIQLEATGRRIKELMVQNGYSVRDLQWVVGLETPQAIYKWLSGRSLPSPEHLVALSILFKVHTEEILVFDGGFCRFKRLFMKKFFLKRVCHC